MASTSKFIDHGPCSNCGSSDAVGIYDDGHGFCNICDAYYHTYNGSTPREASQLSDNPNLTPLTDVFRAIPRRGLTEEAIRKYQIDVCVDKTQDVAHRYPYFRDGKHVANKVRKRSEKTFYLEGENTGGLFGQQLFPAGCAKQITVVEGELDAPSAWLLLGSRWPVVSIKSSGSAVRDCTQEYEYLNSFEKIVLCFDKDEQKTRPNGETYYPGQEAALKVAELFAPGKCRVMTLEHGKDPNEYRQKDIDPKTFVSEWWNAPAHMPDGLVFGTTLWDKIINSPTPFSVPTPWPALNQLIYGFRLGEMITITADPKIGKTSVLKKIEYDFLMNPELIEKKIGVGFMHLEEPMKDLAVGLMGLHIGKRLGLPDTVTNEEELRSAYDAVVNTDRVVIWDSFGSNNVDAVVNKVRHMAALGCKYIILDHFSILASDQANDERKTLDEIATKLKTLTVELNICLIGVIHQNRQGKIRGTMAFEQLSNIIILLERDKLDRDPWRRNITQVIVTDNRFSGRTGPADYLFYDDTSGDFIVLDEVARTKFDEGLSLNDSDVPFA